MFAPMVATVLLCLAASSLAAAPPAQAATASPSVTVSPVAAAPGATVVVNGTNFPPSTNVQAQICGNQALGGSADCDLTTSQEVSTTPQGLFQLDLSVTIPPKPCPCVVMALDFSLSITPTTPFSVIGAPVSSVVPQVKSHKLKVLSLALQGDGPWTSWFGARPQRTLVLTVYNPNATSYDFPPLVLAVGQSSDLTTQEATTHRLATIGPHKTQTYDVPVSFPAVAIGEHQVSGILGNPGLTTRMQIGTWLFPWGLLLVVLIILEIIALLITRGFRERRRRREAAEMARPTPEVSDMTPVA